MKRRLKNKNSMKKSLENEDKRFENYIELKTIAKANNISSTKLYKELRKYLKESNIDFLPKLIFLGSSEKIL